MRVPQFDRLKHRLQALALVICGMIIGAAIFMSITHKQLDYEIKKGRDLQNQLDKVLEDVESLKIYQNKQSIIKSVNVALESESKTSLDDVIVSDIIKRVETDLKSLKGKPIAHLDQSPEQVRELYGTRLLPNIHGKDYIIEIRTMIVMYGDLKIWISAKEYIRQPS